jgi:hypothetical protein
MPLIQMEGSQRAIMPLADSRPPSNGPSGPNDNPEKWVVWQAIRANYVYRHGADPSGWTETGG